MDIIKTSLKNYSSIRVGGESELVSIASLGELVEAVMHARNLNKRVHILGEGTNTFFAQHVENLFVIHMTNKGISCEEKGDDIIVTAEAGEQWDDVVRFASDRGYWGIENLSYIPGTAGAAPVQNIGAYGVELKDVLMSLSALDMKTLSVVEISHTACDFRYRDSLFKHETGKYCILSITLKLSKKSNPILTYKPLDSLLEKENCTVEDVRNLVITTRKSKLPDYKEYPNAGSFFKNPIVESAQGEALRVTYPDIPLITHPKGYKIPAAWLIEHIAKMKAYREGDLGTWPNQPLVIVNYGGATDIELLDFSQRIIDVIKERTRVVLEKEVNYIT